MKMRIILIAAIVVLNGILANAQDSKEIERTYPKADVYIIGEGLWMTPSYTDNGQVCMMRIYPRSISETTSYPGRRLDLSEALKFINELFPVNTRGRRGDGFGLSDIGGGIIWTKFNYDTVRFVFISTYDNVNLSERKTDGGSEGKEILSGIGFDFPVNEAALEAERKREEAKPDDQLIREHAFNARMLEIYWANRKCSSSR